VNINDITSLELELTSRCNAACPLCPRTNLDFSSILDHKREITIENLKQWLPKEILINVKELILKGTFSDPLISRHIVEIIEWFNSNTNVEQINIYTNGSLRNKNFWQWLAKTLPVKSTVTFAIDGLEDTHSIYRVNTDYNKIIENAKIFIENGVTARWQFIIFKHNEHQVEDAKKLAKELGFKKFITFYNDRVGESEFVLQNNSDDGLTRDTERKNIIESISKKIVKCTSLSNKRIYINWDGEVFPCCMTGIFSSKTKNYYDFLFWKKKIMKNDFTKNNLNFYTLEQILSFFDDFYSNVETAPRLKVCGKHCGIKNIDKIMTKW